MSALHWIGQFLMICFIAAVLWVSVVVLFSLGA